MIFKNDIDKKKIFLNVVLLLFTSFLMRFSEKVSAQNRHYFFINESSEKAPIDWKAKWIWLPRTSNQDKNHVIIARKKFNISEIVKQAELYITADSHYKIWINGHFVSRGPARCNPHHQSYDILNVEPFLIQGENIIAVKAHYHGIMKSYYTDPYPGLLAQLEFVEGNKKKWVITDKTWKVQRDWSWDSRTEWVNRVNANNFSSCIDFSKAIPHWQLTDYNDENWQNADYQFGQPAWPPKDADFIPSATQKPWYKLVPRDLPPLNETNLIPKKILYTLESPQFSKYPMWDDQKNYNALWHSMQDLYKNIEYSKVSNMDLFLTEGSPLIIKNAYPIKKFTRQPVFHTTVVFDFGKLIQGYPYLSAKGNKGTIIDINYLPYLVDGEIIPGILVDNFSDRLILSGNEDHWENMELRPFRYIAVTFRGNEQVFLHQIGAVLQEYPFENSGVFKVPEEPFLEQFWKAGNQTIKLITTDGFTDNYHENRQYVQTSYYAAKGAQAAFGDYYLQRRYLIQHAQDQLPNGIMPMWAPWGIYEGNTQVPGILEASHFWLMGLHDYYLHSGDSITVASLLDNAERCANALLDLQIKDNLITKPPHPFWIDWAKLAQGEQNFIINALQALAFRDYSKLLYWMGRKNEALKWKTESQKISKALSRFWVEKTGLFADNLNNGIPDENYSEHANALAIVAEIANNNQKKSIIKEITKNQFSGKLEEAVLFNYWIAEALCMENETQEAVNFLKYKYGHMIKDTETETLWEYANLYAENIGARNSMAIDVWKPRTWSAAQAENGYPASILSKWILGLHPLKPGISEILITAFKTPIDIISGKLPSPNGFIEIKKTNNSIELFLPKGTNGKIKVKDLKDLNLTNIKIDEDIHPVSKLEKDILLKPGAHIIDVY